MTKNIAKYAFKSGILPRPRRTVPRVYAKYEQEAIDKQPTGFSDPQMVPKGSLADPPPRAVKNAAFKLANSAKEPSTTSNGTPNQEYKALSAKVRRVYLKQTLEAAEKTEAKRAARRQQMHEQAQELRTKMDQVEDSLATKLTLPSIDQSLLLDGPLVQGRSEAEQRQLELKRRANRTTTRLEQVRQRDSALLALYQEAHNYIIDEDALNNEVDRAFATKEQKSVTDLLLKLSGANVMTGFASNAERDRELVTALTGTVAVKKGHNYDYQPGLQMVADVLDPEMRSERAHEAN